MTKTDLIEILSDKISVWISENDSSIKSLSEQSGVHYEVIRRLLTKEVLPKAENAAQLLDTIGESVTEVYKILREPPYSKTYLPNNPIESLKLNTKMARNYSENDDKLFIYGMTGKLNGTTSSEVESILGAPAKSMVEDILNEGNAREINNRLKRDDVDFHDEEVNLRHAKSISSNALKFHKVHRTHATTFAQSYNDEGLVEYDKARIKIQAILNELNNRPELRGDHLVFQSFVSHVVSSSDDEVISK